MLPQILVAFLWRRGAFQKSKSFVLYVCVRHERRRTGYEYCPDSPCGRQDQLARRVTRRIGYRRTIAELWEYAWLDVLVEIRTDGHIDVAINTERILKGQRL